MSLALQDGFLTTGPPVVLKFFNRFFSNLSFNSLIPSSFGPNWLFKTFNDFFFNSVIVTYFLTFHFILVQGCELFF